MYVCDVVASLSVCFYSSITQLYYNSHNANYAYNIQHSHQTKEKCIKHKKQIKKKEKNLFEVNKVLITYTNLWKKFVIDRHQDKPI